MVATVQPNRSLVIFGVKLSLAFIYRNKPSIPLRRPGIISADSLNNILVLSDTNQPAFTLLDQRNAISYFRFQAHHCFSPANLESTYRFPLAQVALEICLTTTKATGNLLLEEHPISSFTLPHIRMYRATLHRHRRHMVATALETRRLRTLDMAQDPLRPLVLGPACRE